VDQGRSAASLLCVVVLTVACQAGVAASQSAAPSTAVPPPVTIAPATTPAAPSGPSPTATPAPVATQAPAPGPTATRAPVPLAKARWSRVKDHAAFADAGLVAVAANVVRYVAVGVTDADPAMELTVPNADRSAVIWTSYDGVAWQREAVPGGATVALTGVISDPLGFIVWGYRGETQSAMWISPDGLRWEQVPDNLSLTGVAITGIARLGDRFVAVGSRCTTEGFAEDSDECLDEVPVALESSDGRTWLPISGLTGIDEPPNGLASSGSVLVAPVGQGDVYQSTDGAHWTKVTPPGQQGLVISVVGYAGRFVALGAKWSEAESGPPGVPARIWTSTDGRAWRTATLRPSSIGELDLATAHGDEIVALGYRLGGQMLSYRSADGRTWTRMASTPDAMLDGDDGDTGCSLCNRTQVRDLADGPRGVVAVGWTNLESGGARAVVWTLR